MIHLTEYHDGQIPKTACRTGKYMWVRKEIGKVILVSDVNAKTMAWGETRSYTRGQLICEMATRLDLCAVNFGNATPFRAQGNRRIVY